MFSRWQIKALLQGGVSLLPYSHRANRILQKLNGSLDPRSRVDAMAERVAGHLNRFDAFCGSDVQNANFLELGTGVFPLFPVLLALRGANEVYTYDITQLATRRDVAQTFAAIADKREWLTANISVGRPDRLARLGELRQKVEDGILSVQEGLAKIGIFYRVRDASRSDLSSASIDAIASNDVLEHVSRPVLRDLFEEFRRLIKRDGIMSYFINMGDHYAAADSSIGPCNFYRFSENRWRWLNSGLQYQNRLRLSDYRKLLEQAGWEVVNDYVVRASSDELETLPLATQFASYSKDDLLAIHVWLVCRPI